MPATVIRMEMISVLFRQLRKQESGQNLFFWKRVKEIGSQSHFIISIWKNQSQDSLRITTNYWNICSLQIFTNLLQLWNILINFVMLNRTRLMERQILLNTFLNNRQELDWMK